MERKEAVKLLIELENAQGMHVGRWADEFDREESSREYLAKMMEMASELNIPFTMDLEDYREFENDYKYELQDRAGFELYDSCQSKLIGELI